MTQTKLVDGKRVPLSKNDIKQQREDLRQARIEKVRLEKERNKPQPITPEEKIDAMFDSIVLQDDTKLNELRERVKL